MQGAAQLSGGTGTGRDSQKLLMLSTQFGANVRAEMLCDFAHRLASLARWGARPPLARWLRLRAWVITEPLRGGTPMPLHALRARFRLKVTPGGKPGAMGEQLSMLDTMFLELEQFDESAHMHIGAALIFDPLPGGGTPDITEFRDYLRGRVGILPRFAQQLSHPHAGPLTWLTWEPAKEFDPDAHVHHGTLPAPGGEAELHDWLGDFWSHRLDRQRPLWEMTLLDGLEDGRWALATKTHHCLVDGVGSLDIAHVLLDASPDAVPSPSQPLPGISEEVGGHGNGRFWFSPGLVLRGARAGFGAALHPRESLDRVRAAVELIVREEVIGAPQSSLNGPMSGLRHFATR